MSRRNLALGVDLGGTTFAVGLFDRAGQMLASSSRATPHGEEAHEVFQALADTGRGLLLQDGHDMDELAGVAVGVPGRVDPATGYIHSCPNLRALDGSNAREALERLLEAPVLVANDAFCATLGELRYGAGRDVENLVLFTLGTGIGGGVALGNKAMRGPRQLMGEIGHMTVAPHGRRCGCGNFGCLEAMAAQGAILELARRKLQSGRASLLDELTGCNDQALTPRVIAEAAEAGDAVACEVLGEVAEYLGIAILNAVILLDPDLVLLGGGIAAAGEVLFAPIRRTVLHRGCFPQFDPDRIIPAALGNQAGMYGAGALVWEELLPLAGTP